MQSKLTSRHRNIPFSNYIRIDFFNIGNVGIQVGHGGGSKWICLVYHFLHIVSPYITMADLVVFLCGFLEPSVVELYEGLQFA